jgi:nucleotide-binding universal stress UspA family protein
MIELTTERDSLDATPRPRRERVMITTSGPVLIAFDGSPGAEHAIEAAGALLGDREVVVLTVWEPLVVTLTHNAAALVGAGMLPSDDADSQMELQALAVAQHGAGLARDAGFDATARWEADSGTIADAIIAVATEIDAAAIVTGSRGLHGLRALLGSVSERVLERARRPVLVVPDGGH